MSVADKKLAEASSYADIPFKDELRKYLLEALRYPGKIRHVDISEVHLIQALSGLLGTGGEQGSINVPTAVLAVTDSNMGAETLKKIFERVGVKGIWDDVSKQAALRRHFNATNEQECRKEATSYLNDLMRRRNDIAHPTASCEFPSPEKGLEYCDFLQILGRVISEVAFLPR